MLSMPSDPVKPDEDTTQLVQSMLDTAAHWQDTKIGCAGLAANQIGWLRRIIVVWIGAEFEVMINPEWESRDSKMGYGHEGCLSRPGVDAKIKRHKRIACTWETPSGVIVTAKFAHFTARVIQHEIDHLNGIFINN